VAGPLGACRCRCSAFARAASLSTLDFLPTFLSLIDMPLPTDRAFDGIDISAVLFQGSEQGHVTLFHPNSGQKGSIDGKLDGVRWKNWKAMYQTGGAPDCSGALGTVLTHDPPLLFDLDRDPAESNALDTSTEPFKTVVATIAGLLAAQMHSVNTTMQSITDYSTAVADEPCAHYPTSCRSNEPAPGPPAPPPAPPAPPGPPAPAAKCTFLPNTGFAKSKQVPGHRNDPAATEQACCNLCAAIQGCSGAAFTSGQCYYKTKGEMEGGKGRPLKGSVGVVGTWAAW
jgi:hypothetical protein